MGVESMAEEGIAMFECVVVEARKVPETTIEWHYCFRTGSLRAMVVENRKTRVVRRIEMKMAKVEEGVVGSPKSFESL